MGAKVWESKHAGQASYWIFNCPACGYAHVFDGRWKFNGDVEKPTFSPSLLVHANQNASRPRCHSHVADGKIAYCADSEHAMKGQTVDLPDFAWEGA